MKRHILGSVMLLAVACAMSFAPAKASDTPDPNDAPGYADLKIQAASVIDADANFSIAYQPVETIQVQDLTIQVQRSAETQTRWNAAGLAPQERTPHYFASAAPPPGGKRFISMRHDPDPRDHAGG